MLSRTAEDTVRVIRGREPVLHTIRELDELCQLSDQPGALDHLEYRFSVPAFEKKRPTLILSESATWAGRRVTSAVLLYEYMVAGIATGIYAADFLGGARTVVAPARARSWAAFAAAEALMRRGALLVQLSYEGNDPAEHLAGRAAPRRRWASRVRQLSCFMELEPDLEVVMARLGKRTRRNLRHYRRLAESELGAELVLAPDISREEFLRLNRGSSYAVPDHVAETRYDKLNSISTPLLLGLRSSSGEWLSLLGGCLMGPDAMVEWQMNRVDLAHFSLCTAMRAWLLEYAVARGFRRLYFFRGTTHSSRHSMTTEHIVDLVVSRRAVPGWLINRVASAVPSLADYEGTIPSLTRHGGQPRGPSTENQDPVSDWEAA